MTTACRCSTGCATGARTGGCFCTRSTCLSLTAMISGASRERRKVLLIRLLAKAPVGLQVSDHIVEPGDMVTCLSTWFRGYRIEAATTMSLPARLSDRLGRAVQAFSIA
jgi:hypothetical protein